MLKNVCNRVISAVLALAMISCVLLPQTQIVYASYEDSAHQNASDDITEENTPVLTAEEKNVKRFEYDGGDFSVKAEINADAVFSLDGLPVSVDKIRLFASAVDETDDRYSKLCQAVGDDEHTLMPYDVYFCTEDGKKVEISESGAEVSLYFNKPCVSCESDEIGVLRFTKISVDDDGEENISFESEAAEVTGTTFVNNFLTDISFHADAFSLYGIIVPKNAVKQNTKLESENAVADVSVAMQNLLASAASDDGQSADDENGNNGNKIDKFELALTSGTNTVTEDEKDVWIPENSDEGHAFVYQLTFGISTEGDLGIGKVKIRIPKQILKDSTGKDAGELQLPYPAENESYDKNKIDYVYCEDPDDPELIIIYNVKPVSAGTLQIPFMYETSKKTWEYTDMDVHDCQATVTVEYPDGTSATKKTDNIPVYIDTGVQIKSTAKKLNNSYETWQDSWGTAPSDADDYVYFVWKVNSNISNLTQKYNFSIKDTFNGLMTDENVFDGNGKVIGYKMKGSAKYEAPNDDGSSPTVENLSDSGTRTDYVLTAYPKSGLENLEEYKLKNTVTATVVPADGNDAESTATAETVEPFEKEEQVPPVYNPPGESYSINKYGIYGSKNHVRGQNDISSYALESLKTGTPLPGLTYYISAKANAYIRTLEEGASGTEEDAKTGKFGQRAVTYSLSDSEIYLNNSSEPLDRDSYTFDSLEYTVKMQSAVYDEVNLSFSSQNVTDFTSDDVLEFYVLTGDSDEYLLAATYNLGDGTMEIKESDFISSLTKGSVNFKNGVKGWKIETSNKYYSTEFNVYPKITLDSNDTVIAAIGESSRLEVKNRGVLTAAYDKTAPFVSRPAIGTDYVAEVQRNSNIAKRFMGSKNYPGQRCYKVNWETTVSETYTEDASEGAKPVRQDSGVFYDLLPLGCRVDLSSVKVYADGTELTEGEYVVEISDENYKDSGRTLLTVTISEPAEKNYRIAYTTVHLWEDILDNGRYLLNSIAYETGNEDIAGGYPDNGGKISDSTLLEELDPDSDDNRFLYSQATHTINALIPYSSGITKKVASANDASFSDETVVYQDSDYVYSIRMENSSLTSSKDIIILDSIENFCGGRNGSSGDRECDWHGMLESFGLTNLKNKGVEPVIYLTDSEIDLKDYESINSSTDFAKILNSVDADGNPIWKRSEDFGDYSKAKAFAIDLSRKTNGDEFVLGPNESFSFTVNMHSPDKVESDKIDLETYNNIYRSFTSIDTETNNKEYFYVHYDYTTVAYRTVGTLRFKKIDSDTREPIQGIKFNLYGTSVYGTAVDKDIVTNGSGEVYIPNLERGKYVLSETDPTVDYLPGQERTVTVDESGKVTIDPNDGSSDDEPVIENTPRIHGDLNFLKRDALILNDAVLGAEFTLTGTSDYGNKIVKTAVSDGHGVTFEDVELGTYTLTETKAPENYIAAEPYTVKCGEDGIVSIVGLPLNSNGDYVIADMPRQSFTIRKVDAVNQTHLQYAEFTLTSIETDSGEEISKTAVSDMRGVATFDGLDLGTYTLKETAAPKNHALDEKDYTVEIKLVDNQKVVTITDEDGNPLATEADTKYFVFPNEREYNGVIRINKKWVDNDPSGRKTPVIYLSTEEPEVNKYTATINRTLLQNNFPKSTATSIQRDTWSSWEEVQAKGAVKIGTCDNMDDNISDNEKAAYDVYLYSDGTDYYIWSKSETVYLPSDSPSDSPDSLSCKQLFLQYTALTSADLSGLDSSKVTDMTSMFNGCSALEKVNLTGFDISKVKSMESMFHSCSSITELDLSSFGTASGLTSTGNGTKNMFNGCGKVKSIKLPKFKVNNTFTMQNMFSYCTLLQTVTFNTELNSLKPTSIYGLFYKCPALQTLNLSGFDTSSTTDMSNAFNECSKLESLELGDNFVLTNVETTALMFNNCKLLTSLDCSCFGDAPKLKTTQQMFQHCDNLTFIDLSNFTTSTELTSMYEMFGYCYSVEEVRFNNALNTSNVNTFRYMFYQCYKLKELDLSMFNITTDENASVNMEQMFQQCSVLKTIYVSSGKWSTDRVTVHSGMFNSCSSLVGGKGTKQSVAKVINGSYARIDGGPDSDTPGYFTDIAQKTSTTSAITEATESQTTFANVMNSSLARMKESLADNYISLAASEAATEETADESGTEGSSVETTLYVSTANGNWIDIDGDTWVCEFKVYDDEAEYFVWEDIVPGYESDATKNDPKKVNEGKIDKVQTITNKKTEPKVGNLELSKTVKKGGETLADDKTEFKFEITLKGDKITENQSFDTTEFLYDSVKGQAVATVTLTSQTPITISGIPEGTTYSIEEIDVPHGYTSETKSASGDIVDGETKKVNWENSVDEREKGKFHVSKTVELYKVINQLDGTQSKPEKIELTDEETNAEFTFKVEMTNLDRKGSYTVKKDGETLAGFESDTSGNAAVTFTLKHGETADFTDIPIEAKYKITETTTGYDTSYKLSDENSDSGGTIESASGVSYATSEETLESGEDVTAKFTNKKTIYVDEEVKNIDVAVDKVWADDTPENRPESITVYLERCVILSEGFTGNQETCGTAIITADEDGKWQAVFTGMPEKDEQGREYVYSVSEETVPGYDCTNIAEASDESGNPIFTVTNTKRPTCDLSISKTVTGVFGNKAKQFEFTVTLTDSRGKPLNGLYTLDRGGEKVQILFDVSGKAKIGVSHGETVVISNLPQGTAFTVTETDYSEEGYATKSALGNADLQENPTVEGKLDADLEVKYENHRNGVLPTGIAGGAAALIMIGAAALGGIALLKRRKRKEK